MYLLKIQREYKIKLTAAEENYYAAMRELGEFGLIGAGIGGGFDNTSKLHVLKFDEALSKDIKSNWYQAVAKEYERMHDHKAWQEVGWGTIPEGTKIITSIWAMKKKANGT